MLHGARVMQSLVAISMQYFDRYWKGMMLNALECVGWGGRHDRGRMFAQWIAKRVD